MFARASAEHFWVACLSNLFHSSLVHLVYDALGILIAGVIVEPVLRQKYFAIFLFVVFVSVTFTGMMVYYPAIPTGLSGMQKGLLGAIAAGCFQYGYPKVAWFLILYETWKNAGEFFGFASVGVVNQYLLNNQVAVFSHIAGFVSGFLVISILFRAFPELATVQRLDWPPPPRPVSQTKK